MVTARREPISVTLLRALDTGMQRYFEDNPNTKSSVFKLLSQCMHELKNNNKAPDAATIMNIIEDITKITPVIIIIDEFGKNIEYFATDESQQSDLFLLQELAERSRQRHGIPLSIVTLQHMAFDEYAIGTSTTQKTRVGKDSRSV